MHRNRGCPRKRHLKVKGLLGHTGYFPKLFLNSKSSCISKSFKEKISILPKLYSKKVTGTPIFRKLEF